MDFKTGLKHWSRICEHYWNQSKDAPCSLSCPLYRIWCPMNDDPPKNISGFDIDAIAKIVKQWAKDHPTWFDWLETQGVVTDGECGKAVTTKIFEQMPPDILAAIRSAEQRPATAKSTSDEMFD